MEIYLNSYQELTMREFLKATYRWVAQIPHEEPRLALVKRCHEDFDSFFIDEILDVTPDEFWAIFDYLNHYLEKVREFQRGRLLFAELYDLFTQFYKVAGYRYPVTAFCSMQY